MIDKKNLPFYILVGRFKVSLQKQHSSIYILQPSSRNRRVRGNFSPGMSTHVEDDCSNSV